MTIYADILFLTDFGLNWFSLILTSKITKTKSSAPRLLSAAALGAVGELLLLLPINGPLGVLIEFAVSFIMCAVAFRARSFFTYLRLCACLYGSGITLGGSITLICSLMNRSGFSLPVVSDTSGALVIIASLISTVATLAVERAMNSIKSKSEGKLIVEIMGRRICVPYFCDSGNLLRDPLSGKPAIIIGKKHLIPLFGKNAPDIDSLLSGKISPEIENRIRLLPASTICGGALLAGIVPDKVVLDDGKSSREVDAVIAAADSSTYACDSALVPVALL